MALDSQTIDLSEDLCARGTQLLYIGITIEMIVTLIGLFVTMYISYHSMKKLPKLKKLSIILKRLFYCTVICAFIIFCIAITRYMLCLFQSINNRIDSILRSLIICAYNVLILSLLSTLLVRLFTSFKGSIFELQSSIKWIFIILFCLITIGSLLTMLTQIIVSFVYSGDWNDAFDKTSLLSGWTGAITLTVYSLTSIASLCLFIFQLLRFTKFQTNMDSNLNLCDGQLSNCQKKTIDKTSKYTALLSIAIFTSIINAIIWILCEYLWDYTVGETFNRKNSIIAEIAFMTTYIDVIINEICLYLQFSTVAQFYQRYCRYYQGCWDKMLQANVKKSQLNLQKIKFSKISSIINEDEDDEGV